MGFPNYFLVVYDFIKYAKKHNILVGPGRGSAAGSIVSYTLRITDIDPVKYGLIFERFLNPERVSMPDIDIDFDALKLQIKEEIYQKVYPELKETLYAELHDKLKEEIWNELYSSLSDYINGNFRKEIYELLEGRLSEELYEKLYKTLYDGLYNALFVPEPVEEEEEFLPLI